MIFKANERMDQFKLEMNWNQEELEQWALAARQKEEDNLTLEKYRRSDEAKIKELTLQIEKLTIEVARKCKELENEVTETQAAQIELDKTAEEFRRLHQERHELYLQWQETVQNIQRRDSFIYETGEQYSNLKQFYDQRKGELESQKNVLERAKGTNEEINSKILKEASRLGKDRDQKAKSEKEKEDLMSEVATKKNQLSSDAQKLAT
jgi:chromosome segregation ATPase